MKEFAENEILDMQGINGEHTYVQLMKIGVAVATDIQKKYGLSYAEAELVLSVADNVLKNSKLATD